MTKAFTINVSTRGSLRAAMALNNVKKGVKNRVMHQALMKVGSLVSKRAKAYVVPRRTGLLKRAIGVVARKYKGGERRAVVVGARRQFTGMVMSGGFHRKIKASRYTHLVEKGRKRVVAKGRRPLAIPITAGTKKVPRHNIYIARRVSIVRAWSARAVAPEPHIAPAWRYTRTAGRRIVINSMIAGIKREAAKAAARGKSIYYK